MSRTNVDDDSSWSHRFGALVCTGRTQLPTGTAPRLRHRRHLAVLRAVEQPVASVTSAPRAHRAPRRSRIRTRRRARRFARGRAPPTMPRRETRGRGAAVCLPQRQVLKAHDRTVKRLAPRHAKPRPRRRRLRRRRRAASRGAVRRRWAVREKRRESARRRPRGRLWVCGRRCQREATDAIAAPQRREPPRRGFEPGARVRRAASPDGVRSARTSAEATASSRARAPRACRAFQLGSSSADAQAPRSKLSTHTARRHAKVARGHRAARPSRGAVRRDGLVEHAGRDRLTPPAASPRAARHLSRARAPAPPRAPAVTRRAPRAQPRCFGNSGRDARPRGATPSASIVRVGAGARATSSLLAAAVVGRRRRWRSRRRRRCRPRRACGRRAGRAQRLDSSRAPSRHPSRRPAPRAAAATARARQPRCARARRAVARAPNKVAQLAPQLPRAPARAARRHRRRRRRCRRRRRRRRRPRAGRASSSPPRSSSAAAV